MKNSTARLPVTLPIAEIKATHFPPPDNNYTVELIVGSGQFLESGILPVYMSSQRTISWNHSEYGGELSVRGVVQVDFNSTYDSSLAVIEFYDDAGPQVRGGVVIRQTTYPPKRRKKGEEKVVLNHLNAAVSNALFLYQVHLKYDSGTTWKLGLIFQQPGTKYKLKPNGFSIVSVNGDNVLQLLVEPDPQGTGLLTIPPGTVTTAALQAKIPIVVTLAPLFTDGVYYKKGVLHIA